MKAIRRILLVLFLSSILIGAFLLNASAADSTGVAEVGGVTYDTLAAAIEAADNGATVTMLSNTTETGLSIDKKLTVYGGGHTLTVSGTSSAFGVTVSGCEVTLDGVKIQGSSGYLVTTASGGTVRLKSGTVLSGGGTRLLENGAGCTAIVENGASVELTVVLTANNTSAKQGVYNQAGGELHVYGRIAATCTEGYSAYIQTLSNTTGGFLFIYEGASIENNVTLNTNNSAAVWCNGSMTMTGGTITGTACTASLAVCQSTSVITISGGRIENTHDKEFDTDAYTYAAITVMHKTKPTITISGNAVIEATGAYSSALHLRNGGANVTVNGSGVQIKAVSTAIYYGYSTQAAADSRSNLTLIQGTISGADCIRICCKGNFVMKGGYLQFDSNGIVINDTITPDQTHNITINGGSIAQVGTGEGDAIDINAGTATIIITGGSISTEKRYVFRGQSDRAYSISVSDDAEITSSSTSAVFNLNKGTATVTVTGGTIQGAGNVLNSNAGCSSTITFRGTPQVISTGGKGVYVAGNAIIEIAGGSFETKNQTVSTAASTDVVLTLTISGGYFASDSGYVIDLPLTAEDTVSIRGGTFIGSASADATVQVYGVTEGDAPVLNIYDGYYVGYVMCCARAYRGGTLNIWGGNFRFSPTSTSNYKRNVIRAGTTGTVGTVHIYGGDYRSDAEVGGTAGVTVGAVFNGATEGSAFYLHAFTCAGGSAILENKGSGTAALAYPQGTYRFTMLLPQMTTGASVRLVENSSGLRFVSSFDAQTLAALRALADGGVLSYGTIILPWDNLKQASCFSLSALKRAGVKYLDIPAVDGIVECADGSVNIRAAIVNIRDENLSRVFVAIGYVKYTVDGVEVYNYTAFDRSDNGRSIREVAREALNDISETVTSVYRYLTPEGVYSRYTEAQRNILKNYYSSETVIDLYLIAGQSNAAGYSAVNDQFLASNPAFTQGYSNVLYFGTAGSTSSADDYTVLYTNRISRVQAVKVGYGKNESYFGPELGMAEALSAYYNAESGRVAGIIKYAVGGTSLRDTLTAQNKAAGNWASPSYLAQNGAAGALSGGLYRNFLLEVESGIADYRAMGYEVNLKGIYWMQGEGDSQQTDITLTYPNMLKLLIGDMRRDLGCLLGGDYSELPFVIGEISSSYKLEHKACYTEFIAMQNAVAQSMDGVYVNHSGVFGVGTDGSDQSHWTADDGFFIGQMLGSKFATLVLNAEIEGPAPGEAVASVYDGEGSLLGSYASLSYAINAAPAGARVVLLRDITLYGNLNINNPNAIRVDGNGYRIESHSVTHGIRLVGCNVTLENFDFYHLTNAKSAYAVYCYANAALRFESGSLSSYQFGIVVNQTSNVTINGGEFAIRYGEAATSSALYISAGGTENTSVVTVNGGSFIAAGNGSAIAVNALAGNDSTVTINGATLTVAEGATHAYCKTGSGAAALVIPEGASITYLTLSTEE